jgi:hypothetical protein
LISLDRKRVLSSVFALLGAACQFDTRPIVLEGVESGGAGVAAAAPSPGPAAQPPDFGNPAASDRAPHTAGSVAGTAGASGAPAMAQDPNTDTVIPGEPPPLDAGVVSDAAAPAADADGGPRDADTEQPQPPAPGEVFSACAQTADCDPGLVCSNSLTWTQAGYCTPFCGASGAAAEACPQPTSGLVKASCRPDVFLCQLDSCERSQCPDGMRCVDTQLPIGTGQVIYNCQP